MPGRWKIGGCSLAPTQAPSRAPRNAGTARAIGIPRTPARMAGGCAWPLATTTASAATTAASRSPAASDHNERAGEPSPPVTCARAASHRKLPRAIPAPAAAPSAPSSPPRYAAGPASATPSTHASRDTRDVRSLGVIELPLRSVHGSKEHHESGDDPEAEPDEQEPRLGAEPLVRVVAADQADHGREHHPETNRGQLADRDPAHFLPRLRH